MMSLFVLRKSDFVLHIVFYTYAVLVVLKKLFPFQDGLQDVVILLVLFLSLLIRPKRLRSAMGILMKESVFKVFLVLSIYYACLSSISYNTYTLITLEFFSVFKWSIYFFVGYLFGYTYRIKSPSFPTKVDLILFVSIILAYSVSFYNWSGIGGIDNLFGFYDNSFESIFSLRSVFAIFGFVVFVYALNIIGAYNTSGLFLLLSSIVFLFMSGNRKMLIAVVLIMLFMKVHSKYKILVKFYKYSLVAVLLAVMTQTVLFKKSLTEYSNIEQPRIAAYNVSYQIARDYFPFGSGPATFASKGSMVNYSPIYSQYGLDEKWGFREDDDAHFYNDTYWAQIVGQYGVLGLMLIFLMFFYIYRLVSNSQTKVNHTLLLFVVLFISLVTPALQRIEIALFLFFVMGLYAQTNRTQQRGY